VPSYHCDIVSSSHYAISSSYHCAIVLSAIVLSCHSSIGPSYNCIIASSYHGAIVQSVIVRSRYSSIVPLYHCSIASLHHRIIVSSCHYAIVPSWRLIIISSCQCVMPTQTLTASLLFHISRIATDRSCDLTLRQPFLPRHQQRCRTLPTPMFLWEENESTRFRSRAKLVSISPHSW